MSEIEPNRCIRRGEGNGRLPVHGIHAHDETRDNDADKIVLAAIDRPLQRIEDNPHHGAELFYGSDAVYVEFGHGYGLHKSTLHGFPPSFVAVVLGLPSKARTLLCARSEKTQRTSINKHGQEIANPSLDPSSGDGRPVLLYPGSAPATYQGEVAA